MKAMQMFETVKEWMSFMDVNEGEVIIFCNFEGTNQSAEISDYWFTESCWYDQSVKSEPYFNDYGQLCCEIEGIDYMQCLERENIEWLDSANQSLLLRWLMVGEEENAA